MERLILDEQTTPKLNFDGARKAVSGGAPGGVDGLGSRWPLVLIVVNCFCFQELF